VREGDVLKVLFKEQPPEKEKMELNVDKGVLNKLRATRKIAS
jgi:hypothetical protein